MNLVASLVVRNERGRYLAPCIKHLRAFCDEILVIDDASDDGTAEWLADHADDQLRVVAQEASTFYVHEGRTRSALLRATLARNPSHVLAIDADEFVGDGPAVRAAIDRNKTVPVWTLDMQEVWQADVERYRTREDGGWRAHGVACLWRVAQIPRLAIPDRQLACGRVPSLVRMSPQSDSGSALLHVGWLNESERVARRARYTKHDGGRFHASAHLDSILWPAEKVELTARDWPAGLEPWREQITERASVTKAAARATNPTGRKSGCRSQR